MKRIVWILLAALLLCACAAKPETEAAQAPQITAPAETELVLTLPLGLRDEVMKTLPGYTAGFAAENDAALQFSVQSADARVATGVLTSDGTLYVIAQGVGETKLTVTATSGAEQTKSTVSVKVRDARRTLVLILAGALAVVLFVLLGRPVKKEPAAIEETKEIPQENTDKGEPS